MTDRKTALRILEALRRGPVGDTGVLVGSSEGYAPMRYQVEIGFKRLSTLLERLHA
ncbi:MAG: hypothetical protein WAM82_22505 [Thermoanaerobaculia bacterium]